MSNSDWLSHALGQGSVGASRSSGSGFSNWLGGFNSIQNILDPQGIRGTAHPIDNYSPEPPSPYGNQFNFMGDQNQDNSTDDILKQLQGLNDPSRYMADQNSLMQQARASANAQYDPIIAALRKQMGLATERGNRNKAALGQMFGELSNNLKADVPVVQKQYADTRGQTDAQFDQLKGNIKQTYADANQQQEDVFKRLNIEAAAPAVTEQQTRDQAFFQNNADKEKQTLRDVLTTQEGGAVNYARQGGEIAIHEGTERQANLMQDLSDMLSQLEGQVGANEAAKEQSYTSALGQLQSQANESASKRAQSDFNNYIATINLGRGLKSDQLAELKAMSNQGTTATKALSDVAPRALSMGLDQTGATRIQNSFMAGLSDPSVQAGMDPDTGSSLSPEARAARIVEAGRQQGLSSAEINALQNIALEYFGRR